MGFPRKKNSSCEVSSVRSPTSVIPGEGKTWDLPVDVSFDESMNAETTLSTDSYYTFEDGASKYNNHDESKESKVATEMYQNQIGSHTNPIESPVKQTTKVEKSFYDMVSQYVFPSDKKADPLRRMKSDAKQRTNHVPEPLRRNKSTSVVEKSSGRKSSHYLPPRCPNDNAKSESHSKVPLKPQSSTESTVATSTNLSLSQSMTEMFDESLVWSISDICSTSLPIDQDQNGKTIVFNNYTYRDQGAITQSKNNNQDVSRLKNRVWTGNSQAKHSLDLRYRTAFNDIHDMDIIQTTKSFGDDFVEEEFETKQSELPVTLMMDTFGISTPCPSFCLFPTESNLKKKSLNSKWNDEDTCYDSDPGEVRFRHRRPRRAFVKNDKRVGPSMLRTNSMKSRLSKFSQYMDTSRLDIEYSNHHYIEVQVEEMKNMTMNVIWHPGQRSESRPLKITRSRAWIEMGSLLSQTVIHPKLMWKPAYEPDLFRRKINSVPPYSIDLLDIIGIVPVKYIDRNEHPFARPSCSFKVITVSERYFLFEAEDRGTRDKIVFGLKLIIARLASKVLVAGDVAEDEFFTPGGRQVHEAWWLEDEK